MNYNIDYNYTQVALDKVEIADISNVCLRISNDLNYEWYLAIITDLGITQIKEFGPCLIDSDLILNGFSYKYNELDYMEGKICSRLDKFIQDPKRAISKVEIITLDDFKIKLTSQIK